MANKKNTTKTSAPKTTSTTPDYSAQIGGTISYLTKMVQKWDKPFFALSHSLEQNGIIRPRTERNNGKGVHLTVKAHRAFTTLSKGKNEEAAKGASFILEVATQRKEYAKANPRPVAKES